MRKNMKSRLVGFVLALAAVWIGLAGAAFAVYEVPIYSPSLTKFSVAIPDLKNLGASKDELNLARQCADVLADDLSLSGYFKVLDRMMYLEDAKKAGLTAGSFDFHDWTLIKADTLIKGGFVVEGDSVTLELRLYDVFQRKQTLGKRYTGRLKEYRLMCHKFANEIIFLLTGEKGIFGTKIAFVSKRTGNKEVYTIDVDGQNMTQITRNGSINLSPAWSPDGKILSFTSYMKGSPQLYFIKPQPGSQPALISGRPGLNIGATWHPTDNNSLSLTLSKDGNSELYMISKAGKILSRLTVSYSIEVSPSFSPDGSKISFVSDRSGTPQIYVMNADGTGVKRLTFEGNYNVSPAWSPKGDVIAYQGLEGSSYQMYLIDPAGAQTFRLSDGVGSNEDPSWSPDGRAVVFSSTRGGDRNLYIMNIDGSYIKQLTFGKGDDTSPAWSPRPGE